MSKKQPMKQLKVAAAQISRPAAPRPAAAAPGAPAPAQGPLSISVQVENPNDTPLYVWASRRAYEYDPATHVLTLYLTDHTPAPPPGIKIISQHPRTPEQVQVGANSRASVNVPLPAVIRRRVPGQGLGMSFVEEPIGQIDRVELHIQSAGQPIESIAGESAADHMERLRAHGTVLRVTVPVTGKKGD